MITFFIKKLFQLSRRSQTILGMVFLILLLMRFAYALPFMIIFGGGVSIFVYFLVRFAPTWLEWIIILILVVLVPYSYFTTLGGLGCVALFGPAPIACAFPTTIMAIGPTTIVLMLYYGAVEKLYPRGEIQPSFWKKIILSYPFFFLGGFLSSILYQALFSIMRGAAILTM
jgi:hypothetical protein